MVGSVGDLATALLALDLFPYFDIASSIAAALAERTDLGPYAGPFARRHPLACWLSTLFGVFASGVLTNALLGAPILAPLNNGPQVLVATVCWWLVFYAPHDVAYRALSFPPVQLALAAANEVYRGRNIHIGVMLAGAPFGWVVRLFIGTLRGNGAGFGRLAERLVRFDSMEFIYPSFLTKCSFLASAALLLTEHHDATATPLVLLAVVAGLVAFRIAAILLGPVDPFVAVENGLCRLFMRGGVASMGGGF